MMGREDRFRDQGVLVSAYHGAINFTDQQSYQKSVEGRVKAIAKKLLSRTTLGTKIALRHAHGKHAEEAVSSYKKDNKTADVALFHDIWSLLTFAREFPDFPGATICVHHGNGEFSKMLREAYPHLDERWVAKLEKQVMNVSDCIVFVGEENKNRFLRLHPEAKCKSVHIHTGIDDVNVERGICGIRDAGEELEFVVVGTVCTRKNQRVLIDLLDSGLLKEPVRFIIVGDGPDLKYCMQEASRCNLEDAFVFTGPSDDVRSHMVKADALVSVSFDEGLPTVALEAMSLGLPLLLTDVGGCSELVDGNGVLAAGCDVAILADAFNKFFDLYRGGKISGARSRNLFEDRYTTEHMCDEYAELVKRLCEIKKAKTEEGLSFGIANERRGR
jgi:glycosyltransferase involved in cell wall biosynthesis